LAWPLMAKRSGLWPLTPGCSRELPLIMREVTRTWPSPKPLWLEVRVRVRVRVRIRVRVWIRVGVRVGITVRVRVRV